MATVPWSAIRSKNVRQAANSCSDPPVDVSTPRRVSRAGSIQRRSASSGTYVSERLRDLRASRRLVVGLEQAGTPPDHLAERPEADALAVGRAPPDMPVGRVDHAVDVLRELPAETGLADAGGADDRDESGAPFAARRMEQVLEQAQLIVAADERCLKRLRPVASTELRDDPERPPGRHRDRLALERLLARFLERDRARCGAVGRLADEDRARRRGGLEARGRVHEVARDHALVRRSERDRRFAGQDTGTGLDGRPERADGVDELKGGPHGPLSIVLVSRRCAPDRHDGIADELLDRAAVAPDDVARQLEVAGSAARGCPLRPGLRRGS